MKDVGIPLSIVLDNILEISKVSTTPKIIIASTASVDAKDCIAPVK